MRRYEYRINGRSYVVDILSFDGREAAVRVNGTEYRVKAAGSAAAPMPDGRMAALPVIPVSTVTAPEASRYPASPSDGPVPAAADCPLSPAAPEASPAHPPSSPVRTGAAGGETICAPMPGIILSVLVREGQAVTAGDPMLVLEAMKMENEIHAPRSGTVKSVLVHKGAEVRQGTPLIELG
ncbi:MAG: biotin/lipoyl-containing protein [bacterium]